GVGVGVAKNSPLRTAFRPGTSLVMTSCTWPVRFHTRYLPETNEERSRLSRTCPVAGWVAWASAWRGPKLCDARAWRATWWALPSVRLMSIVKELPLYQVAAARLAGLAAVCGARGSAVEASQV